MAETDKPQFPNQEAFKDFNSKSPVRNTAFYFQFVQQLTDDLIQSLRDYFTFNPRVPSTLRWVGKPANSGGSETDNQRTGIHVSAEHADNEQFYPSVLVASVNANLDDFFLNRQNRTPIVVDNPLFDPKIAIADQEAPQQIELGFSMSGKTTFTVTLRIRGNQPPELDQVTDVVIHGLIGPVRRELEHKYQYNYVPGSARVSDRSTETYTNKSPIHARTITLSLYGSWEDVFYYSDPNVTDVLTNMNREGPETI